MKRGKFTFMKQNACYFLQHNRYDIIKMAGTVGRLLL